MLNNQELYDKIRDSGELADLMNMQTREQIVERVHQIARDAGRTDLTLDTIDAQINDEPARIVDQRSEDDSLSDEELELVVARASMVCYDT
ncbi:hypothetical protein [Puniceibacterium sediminis]|uniref:Uncharacterized protein n=1 Tax=Puniceibacterium sediminis TaxID=1608407 RepID=A0A238ZUB5_9RHOB|nr:hypothetical protein [Puniceibacterium sediminis]SNR87017.1 hypothetical protein SAMN06265370_1431 [Puniceibacterium sediminis]